LPWPSGSFVLAAPPGVDPRSRGSEPRALPLSYGASNGQGGRLRSCGLVRPGHALYQTKLHPEAPGAIDAVFHGRSIRIFATARMEHTAGVEPAFSVQLPLSCFVGRRATCAWQSRRVSIPLLADENRKS